MLWGGNVPLFLFSALRYVHLHVKGRYMASQGQVRPLFFSIRVSIHTFPSDTAGSYHLALLQIEPEMGWYYFWVYLLLSLLPLQFLGFDSADFVAKFDGERKTTGARMNESGWQLQKRIRRHGLFYHSAWDSRCPTVFLALFWKAKSLSCFFLFLLQPPRLRSWQGAVAVVSPQIIIKVLILW